MIYYTASEINLSRHTLKLKLPKYRLKKGSIPQYRKPQCLPSSPCTSLGSSHCGNIYFILKVKQHCSRLWVGKLLIQISWILTKIIQPLPQPRPSSSSLVPLRGGKIPGDQRSHPHASGYFWKRRFSSPFSKKKKTLPQSLAVAFAVGSSRLNGRKRFRLPAFATKNCTGSQSNFLYLPSTC